MPYSVSMPITRRTVMRTLCSSGSVYPPFICPSLCPSQCPRVTELWHRRLFHLYHGRAVPGRGAGPAERPLDGPLGGDVHRVRDDEGGGGGDERGGPGREGAGHEGDEGGGDHRVEQVERVGGGAQRGERGTGAHAEHAEGDERHDDVDEGDGDDHAG